MPTYNAYQVAEDGSLQPTQRELVEPEPGHVRVKVQACGVCHSDALAVRPHPAAEPGLVPGHEAAGRIDAVGEGVTGWAVGDRAGVGFLGGHCHVCEQCRRGHFTACTDQPMTGVSTDGGYAEYLYARESGLVAIPDGLAPTAAAPLLCAGFTTYNALVKADPKPGDLVAVQGIGGLGHLGVQYARAMGAEVAAVARGTQKAEVALDLGAHHYIDSTTGDPGEKLRDLGGADVILATASSGASVSALITALTYGGRLMVVGASPDPIPVGFIPLVFGGAEVLGSLTGSSIENEDNLRFALGHDIAPMIEEVPLEGAPAAFDRMMNGAARFRMVLDMA
jgi:propanol-preferring alcohol dehydrogenase